jgi:hypothetical protein
VFLNADSENFISRFPFVIIKTLLTVVIMLPATCGTLAHSNLTDSHFLQLLPGPASGKFSVRCMVDMKGCFTICDKRKNRPKAKKMKFSAV